MRLFRFYIFIFTSFNIHAGRKFSSLLTLRDLLSIFPIFWVWCNYYWIIQNAHFRLYIILNNYIFNIINSIDRESKWQSFIFKTKKECILIESIIFSTWLFLSNLTWLCTRFQYFFELGLFIHRIFEWDINHTHDSCDKIILKKRLR